MLKNLAFHHEGVISENLEDEIRLYEFLGFQKEFDFWDPLQKVHGQFMIKDLFRVELLEPTSEDSPLKSYIKRKIKIYHHAFTTSDLEDSIKCLQENQFLLLGEPQFSVAFQNKIAFLLSPSSLLLELIQDNNY